MTRREARRLAWAYLWAANCTEPPHAISDMLPEKDAEKVEREFDVVVEIARGYAGEGACRIAAPERFGLGTRATAEGGPR